MAVANAPWWPANELLLHDSCCTIVMPSSMLFSPHCLSLMTRLHQSLQLPSTSELLAYSQSDLIPAVVLPVVMLCECGLSCPLIAEVVVMCLCALCLMCLHIWLICMWITTLIFY